MISMTEAVHVWRTSNDSSGGFEPAPWYTDRAATVDEAVDHLIEHEGAKLAVPRASGDEIAIIETDDGRLIGIGVGGPEGGAWAVLLD